jgi:hypothetical protein
MASIMRDIELRQPPASPGRVPGALQSSVSFAVKALG